LHKAFISYSRQDAEFVSQMQAHLLAAQFDIWRDVHGLNAGDRWPRKLGDAIAASPTFILIWSANAAHSDFVELEWTVAIALKRTICIVSLDASELPPTLRPYEIKNATAPQEASLWLLHQAPAASTPLPAAANPVLQKLSATSDASGAKQIASEITIAFLSQSASHVQGHVFQSAGPMNVYLAEQNSARFKGKYVAIVAGLVLAAAIGVEVFHRPPTPEIPTTPQPFGGFIQDDQGRPLPGVTITAPTLAVPPQETDPNGRFSFQIGLPAGTNFRLIAQKAGFETYTADPPSGDTTFNITLRQVSEKRSR
jgi:hypothetical protein